MEGLNSPNGAPNHAGSDADLAAAQEIDFKNECFKPIELIGDNEFNEIIAKQVEIEGAQDKKDDAQVPRGMRALAAAADDKVDARRQAWEIRTFGKALGEMTIGDLVVGLRSELLEKRRACAEALKEESKADLRLLEAPLRAATLDPDQWVAGYAQDCLDKAELKSSS